MAFQRILSKTIVALALTFAGAPAQAQFALQPTLQPQPYESNVWYDPAYGGSGWTIAWLNVPSIPSGRLGSFGFYTYDETGRATWLFYQHPYEAVPVSQIVQGNPIGRMSGDFLEFRGGPTPTGPATPAASIVSPFGPATLRWISPTVIEATYGGVTRRLIPGEFAVGLASGTSILEGTWRARFRVGGAPSDNECVFRLTRVAAPGQRWEPRGNLREIPAADSQWFEPIPVSGNRALCVDNQRFELRLASGQIRVWNLPVSQQLPDLSGYWLGEGGLRSLYLQSATRMVGWDHTNRVGDGTIFIEFEFAKTP